MAMILAGVVAARGRFLHVQYVTPTWNLFGKMNFIPDATRTGGCVSPVPSATSRSTVTHHVLVSSSLE